MSKKRPRIKRDGSTAEHADGGGSTVHAPELEHDLGTCSHTDAPAGRGLLPERIKPVYSTTEYRAGARDPYVRSTPSQREHVIRALERALERHTWLTPAKTAGFVVRIRGRQVKIYPFIEERPEAV